MFDTKKAREICEAEKSGCWTIQQGEYYTEIYDASNSSRPFAAISDKNKADFIAFARTSLPEALDEIERLQVENKKTEEKYNMVNKLLFGDMTVSFAAIDAIKERQRQVEQEKFSAKHDDKYFNEELSMAAACYALTDEARDCMVLVENLCTKQYAKGPHQNFIFPFSEEWWKPSPDNRRRELIKAAALIIAEIERVDRKEALNNAGL